MSPRRHATSGRAPKRERSPSATVPLGTSGKRAVRKRNKFPPGWDEERVRRVLAHYEQQTEDEAVAEDEAARENRTQTMMQVPRELVPKIRQMIANHTAARRN